ncbi:MAG: mechanosensitive ion channel family protein, partial [Acidiferrobacterales bacterium]
MISRLPIRRLFLVFALALATLASGGAHADAPVNDLKPVLDQVRQIERDLKYGRYSVSELSNKNKQLTDFATRANSCVDTNQAALTKVDEALKRLGRRKPGESIEVTKQRAQHESERAAIEAALTDCQALVLHVNNLQEDVGATLKKLLEQHMLARGPDILTVIGRTLTDPVNWFADSIDYFVRHSWELRQATPAQLLTILVAALFGLILGLGLRLFGLPLITRRAASKKARNGRVATTVLAACCHQAPYVLTGLGASILLAIFTYDVHPVPVLSALVYGLTAFFLVSLVIYITLDPVAPGQRFVDVPPAVTQPLAYRLRVLMVLVLIVIPLVDTVLGLSLPSFARSLVHSVVRLLLAINIVWLMWLFRYLRGIKRQAWFRRALSLVLVVAVIGDLIGYSNLSSWLIRSVFGSIVAVGLVTALGRLLRDGLIAIEYGKTPWGQKVRRIFGLSAKEEHLGSLFWIRMLVTLGLWTVLAWSFIVIWDLSTNVVQQITKLMTEGFLIGSLKIVPARVALAVVILITLVAVTSWLKGLIKLQLEKSPMERGSREALVTVSGYSGVVIALVVGLGVAGISFANLAIIVGALSVGIGFGLQNIVNNFLSGLILLVERPVKTGDWIVVGGTEGYVKRIRIRSTQIQTFDHADVIVPNSELIASQVTNWMLRDTTGRARIPVGVAYGSDTQKVKEILLQVAQDHPDVITNRAAMEPFVLFFGFGDSSLNFELRVFIKNIDKRLRVISDLNFAIDAAFREAGIEIPFPQRDVHIRSG